jgi:amidase
MVSFMEDIDVVLSPVSPRAPWKVDDVLLDMPTDEFYARATGFSDFCALHNCTGQPAISLPLHTNAAGMPVGAMFAARYGDEKTLYRLGAQIERSAPWDKRISPMLADALKA